MKKLLFLILFILPVSPLFAQIQMWAIGAQVGEPFAVGVRKYGDRNALDVKVGSYIGLFKNKTTYKTSNDDLAAIGLMFNATYVWYVPFLNERMSAYAGPGVQVNSRRYYPNRDVKSVHTNNISTGPSGTVGLEFFFAQKPTSLFLEGGGYIELIPKIFYFNPTLAFGLRHNF